MKGTICSCVFIPVFNFLYENTLAHAYQHTHTNTPKFANPPQDPFHKPNIELPVMLQQECIIGRKYGARVYQEY